MLQFEALKKSYGRRRVFGNLRGAFDTGLFAITGPNGSGKSTLLGLLSGAIAPDSGSVRIDGHDLASEPLLAKRALSYVPDECPVYPFLTGRAYLEFVAKVKQYKLDVESFELIDGFGIRSNLDTRFDAMSLGTQRKFMCSAAWIADPRVLLIDEPTNALDADSLAYLIERLTQRRGHGVTICTTHDREFIAATGAEEVPLLTLEGPLSTSPLPPGEGPGVRVGASNR